MYVTKSFYNLETKKYSALTEACKPVVLNKRATAEVEACLWFKTTLLPHPLRAFSTYCGTLQATTQTHFPYIISASTYFTLFTAK